MSTCSCSPCTHTQKSDKIKSVIAIAKESTSKVKQPVKWAGFGLGGGKGPKEVRVGTEQ